MPAGFHTCTRAGCEHSYQSRSYFLIHMVTVHDGIGSTEMRRAGVTGNPSQAKAEAEAQGVPIHSRRRKHPNGHQEVVLSTKEGHRVKPVSPRPVRRPSDSTDELSVLLQPTGVRR